VQFNGPGVAGIIVNGLKRIPSLDGLRAVSILLVLFAHSRYSVGFPVQLSRLAYHCAVGVTVFFVISGFLITTLLLTEEAKNGFVNRTDFYIRRAFRILPIFLLFILFVTLWRKVEAIGLTNGDILHALTFTVNFAPGRGSWFISHFWTLSVEEQFYLLWPTVFIISRKHLKPVLCVFIIYSCISRAIWHRYPEFGTVALAPYFSASDAIMIGALGGILLFENPGLTSQKIFDRWSLKLLAIIIIAFFVYCVDSGKLSIIAIPFGNVFISASILFLVFAYLKPSNSLAYKFLNNKIMVHIGLLSYSLYVWQQFFIKGSTPFTWRTFPLNILFIYLAALASYYLWEQPFLKFRKTHFAKAPAKVLVK